MALDFPSSPVDGQVSGNYIYSASSGAWKSKPIAGATTIHSSVMPLSANPGDVWFNINDGTSFTYFDDGTSKQWVEMISSGVPNVSVIMPTGSIIQTALPTAPAGWLFCQGQEIQISAFQPLYNAITVSGTVFSYGANTNGSGGAGSTHFRLPDLRGRVPVGADPSALRITANNLLGQSAGAQTHTLSVSEMPSHTHTQDAHNHAQDAHSHGQSGHTWAWGAYAGTVHTPTNAYGGNSGGANYLFTVQGGYGYNTTLNATATNQSTTATNQYTGGGGAHNNLQPYIILNHMIKT